jgi:hypothetical protein
MAGTPDGPLTPEARRRADAVAGRPIELLDGREWEFPEVVIEFAEAAEEDGGIAYLSNISPAFDRALMDWEDDAQREWQARNSLRMAGELLRRNYAVTVPETATLIRWNFAAGLPRLYEEIMAAARGLARPKPAGIGSPGDSGSPG